VNYNAGDGVLVGFHLLQWQACFPCKKDDTCPVLDRERLSGEGPGQAVQVAAPKKYAELNKAPDKSEGYMCRYCMRVRF